MDKTTLNAQLVTNELKRVFYHSNLLTAKDQICGKFWFGCQRKELSSLILLLVRLVFRRYE